MKNIRIFLSENFQFLVEKFSVYLNRRVFVMNGFTYNALCFIVFLSFTWKTTFGAFLFAFLQTKLKLLL